MSVKVKRDPTRGASTLANPHDSADRRANRMLRDALQHRRRRTVRAWADSAMRRGEWLALADAKAAYDAWSLDRPLNAQVFRAELRGLRGVRLRVADGAEQAMLGE